MAINTQEATVEGEVIIPVEGNPAGKDLLSMYQLTRTDIFNYLQEAGAADLLLEAENGVDLLPRTVLKAVMRQPSTRTGGSMTTAMAKLGGFGELISGMSSSAEAKGESLEDSWVAFATQADIIGARTKEDEGPQIAVRAIDTVVERGQLRRKVPVINLGNGKDEHPSQAIGDLYTIARRFGIHTLDGFEGMNIVLVGDLAWYRAHHSLMIGAVTLGANVQTVEIDVAPTPGHILEYATKRGVDISHTDDIDEVIDQADVVYMGRKPSAKEFSDTEVAPEEDERTRLLLAAYEKWMLTPERVSRMKAEAAGMHPRPRGVEIPVDVDADPRMADVEQMDRMIAARMGIIASHMGKSILEAVRKMNGKVHSIDEVFKTGKTPVAPGR